MMLKDEQIAIFIRINNCRQDYYSYVNCTICTLLYYYG